MKILWMNMQLWIIITAYVLMCSNLCRCQKHTLESARHSYMTNSSQNSCPKSESDILYPRIIGKLTNYHKGYENDMVELIKHKFSSMAGNKMKLESRRDDVQDDPNLIQALMSRAFIDNANFAFHKNEKEEDPASFLTGKHGFQMIKYPKLKTDLIKPFHASRGKRDTVTDRTSDSDDFDESDDGVYEKREKTKDPDESEMRIHCIRTGPSEVLCKHENYTFHFKLPSDLFDKKIMENLVSSVCSIIEEASPDGGGRIEVSVKKSANNVKKERESTRSKSAVSNKLEPREPAQQREHKEDPERVVNKVIRINIPIDFSAIPLGIEEDDKNQNEKSEKEVSQDSKRMRDSENVPVHTKEPIKSIKKIKYQQTKADDNYSLNSDFNSDMLALRPDYYSQTNAGEDDKQEKWLSKRDNPQNSMVLPPRLILFKRSPQEQTTQHSNYEKNFMSNSTEIN